MPATSKQTRQLSDADLQQLLELTKGADSVELKLTVPDSERRSSVTALGMDPLDAQIRQVYFFDTPDLVCNRQGVVVRARRVQGRGDDAVHQWRDDQPVVRPAYRARAGRPSAAGVAQGLGLAAAVHRLAAGPCPLPVPVGARPPNCPPFTRLG